jgi:hypothetical protein
LAALAHPSNLNLEGVLRKAKTHACLITPVVCRSVDVRWLSETCHCLINGKFDPRAEPA